MHGAPVQWCKCTVHYDTVQLVRVDHSVNQCCCGSWHGSGSTRSMELYPRRLAQHASQSHTPPDRCLCCRSPLGSPRKSAGPPWRQNGRPNDRPTTWTSCVWPETPPCESDTYRHNHRHTQLIYSTDSTLGTRRPLRHVITTQTWQCMKKSIVHCSIIRSCQSAATSETAKCFYHKVMAGRWRSWDWPITI